MTDLAKSSAWISDPVSPRQGGRWDLLVIGGGTAGLVAAKAAAGFGATVLLVEKDRTGGDCLWTGCVPSKTLLSAAHTAALARRAGRYGVTVTGVEVDFAAVMRQVRAVIDTIEPTDSPAALRAAGVRVAHGTATFPGRRTSQVDGAAVSFRRALVATGAEPVMPPIPGLAQAGPLTSETIWALTALPERLLVLGGGSIGCELGQAFARLGSSVSIVEAAATLLVGEGPDAAALVTAALTADGVSVRTGVLVQKVSTADHGWCAELADGSAVARPTCAPAPPWCPGAPASSRIRRVESRPTTSQKPPSPVYRSPVRCTSPAPHRISLLKTVEVSILRPPADRTSEYTVGSTATLPLLK